MEGSGNALTLYWHVGSQPSRSVKALLLAGGVEHKSVVIDIFSEEQKGEVFTKINPRQMVPFI